MDCLSILVGVGSFLSLWLCSFFVASWCAGFLSLLDRGAWFGVWAVFCSLWCLGPFLRFFFMSGFYRCVVGSPPVLFFLPSLVVFGPLGFPGPSLTVFGAGIGF